MFHPRILGLDGRLKSKKEIEGLNKVLKKIKQGNYSLRRPPKLIITKNID